MMLTTCEVPPAPSGRLKHRKGPSRLRIFAAPAAACLVASCRPAGVLDPQGPVASAERLILLNATGIMLVVVLPVIALTLIFAWWYRASNKRAVYWPDWSYSGDIELVVWSIPACRLIGNGCSFTRTLRSPRSTSSSFRPGYQSQEASISS